MALWQTRFVAARLAASGPLAGGAMQLVEVVVKTEGDRRLDVPIAQLGGKGVFAKEVQAAVLDGRADIAVHSGKDLPSATPAGLVVAAVLPRHDPRDALVGCRLADLPPGARVGTGSPRRRAQLAWLRPDLSFVEIRGNVGTRLGRAGEVDALVLAAAGLDRLELAGRIAERLDPLVMLPQVAQGTLVVECRARDAATLAVLAAIDDQASRRVFEAERGFLIELGGDCNLPAAAMATLAGEEVVVEGLLASLNGNHLVRTSRSGALAEATGRSVARALLDDAGGSDVLAAPGAGAPR
jgi:hydroxymethylbilane synthase